MAALAASATALRYGPFLFLSRRDWKCSRKGETCERAREEVVGEPNQATLASRPAETPLSLRLPVTASTRAGHQGKPLILAQTMSPTPTAPDGAAHLEADLEKAEGAWDLPRLPPRPEEEVEVEDEEEEEEVPGMGGVCRTPGGRETKVSPELHSEIEDLTSSALSTLHTEAFDEAGRPGSRVA